MYRPRTKYKSSSVDAPNFFLFILTLRCYRRSSSLVAVALRLHCTALVRVLLPTSLSTECLPFPRKLRLSSIGLGRVFSGEVWIFTFWFLSTTTRIYSVLALLVWHKSEDFARIKSVDSEEGRALHTSGEATSTYKYHPLLKWNRSRQFSMTKFLRNWSGSDHLRQNHSIGDWRSVLSISGRCLKKVKSGVITAVAQCLRDETNQELREPATHSSRKPVASIETFKEDIYAPGKCVGSLTMVDSPPTRPGITEEIKIAPQGQVVFHRIGIPNRY